MNDEQTPALREAVENMANMREAYDNLSQAAEAYNTGKTELAANITAKGVPASATETLPELAEKVVAIAQTQTILEGGEVMAAQLFGDGALWNLYQVLADMKTRFMGNGDYAALIVCEYYKGYDSLQLQGADAYYTCDGDLYEYASPNHVWHDADNGKANRWVAFLYRDEGARLDITNTAISPRSMYIGGHIGKITYFVNGRLTELVAGVEETDVVDLFNTGSFTNPWGRDCVIRGVKNFFEATGVQYRKGVTISVAGLCAIDGLDETIIKDTNCSVINANASYIVLRGCKVARGGSADAALLTVKRDATSPVSIDIYDLEECSDGYNLIILDYTGGAHVQRIYIPDLKSCTVGRLWFGDSGQNENIIDVVVGAMYTNLNCKYWNPTAVLSDATKKAKLIDNIKNHILARVSDATGGTQLVFTVSTNMYNEIASETITWNGKTMTLADAFLTKNWLLAGA